MEVNKAIKNLKNLQESINDYCGLNERGTETFTMALSALEKHVEKKPSVNRKFYGRAEWTKMYHCPVCGAVFIHEDSSDGFYAGRKFNYCPDCGQKIDWSETE